MSKKISNSSALVKGTLILTLATILSKVLGFIYVVPFTALVGTQGYILYEYAYKPYVLILSVATIGLPAAVSKFVSKYNALGDYETGQKLYRSGLIILTITGTVCFGILYTLAPAIAGFIIDPNDTSGNSVEDVTYVIRMVSFALICVPPMAISRGFFQGYKNFTPTAISQVVEQLVRIAFILISALVVLKVFDKSISTAVGYATFAAFLGAIAGSIALLYFWNKEKDNLRALKMESVSTGEFKYGPLYKELFTYAIPLVITGLSISLYQTIDTFMINKAMMNTGVTQLEAETVNSITSLVQKIILIPTSLATAMSLSLLPTITSAFTEKNKASLQSLISKSMLIVSFLTLPCIALLMALSNATFAFLFPSADSSIGSELMFWYAPTAFFISIYLVTTPILQGMSLHRIALTSLFIGLAIKFFSNMWFVETFQGIGSAYSTNIGLLVSIVINLYYINKHTQFVKSFDWKNILTSFIYSIVAMIVAISIDALIADFILSFDWNSYIANFLRLLIAGGFAGIIFLVISYKTKLIEHALGESFVNKIDKLLKKLRLIK